MHAYLLGTKAPSFKYFCLEQSWTSNTLLAFVNPKIIVFYLGLQLSKAQGSAYMFWASLAIYASTFFMKSKDKKTRKAAPPPLKACLRGKPSHSWLAARKFIFQACIVSAYYLDWQVTFDVRWNVFFDPFMSETHGIGYAFIPIHYISLEIML